MSTQRYACLNCYQEHNAPGFCPHCPRGELLDMTIPSDRELLLSRKLLMRTRSKRLWIFFAGALTWLGFELGLWWVLSRTTEWNITTINMFSLLGIGVLIMALTMWHYRSTAAAPAPERSAVRSPQGGQQDRTLSQDSTADQEQLEASVPARAHLKQSQADRLPGEK